MSTHCGLHTEHTYCEHQAPLTWAHSVSASGAHRHGPTWCARQVPIDMGPHDERVRCPLTWAPMVSGKVWHRRLAFFMMMHGDFGCTAGPVVHSCAKKFIQGSHLPAFTGR